MRFTLTDFLNAFVLMFFIQGCFYVFLPKVMQNFAINCIIDAHIEKLRVFGVILIILSIFIYYVIFPLFVLNP